MPVSYFATEGRPRPDLAVTLTLRGAGTPLDSILEAGLPAGPTESEVLHA
jgi:hypothetical protein